MKRKRFEGGNEGGVGGKKNLKGKYRNKRRNIENLRGKNENKDRNMNKLWVATRLFYVPKWVFYGKN